MKWIISFLIGAVAGIMVHSYAVSGRVYSGGGADASEERTTVVERRDTTVVRVPVVRERRVVDTLLICLRDSGFGWDVTTVSPPRGSDQTTPLSASSRPTRLGAGVASQAVKDGIAAPRLRRDSAPGGEKDGGSYIALPVEQRVYGDSSYTAWVSGVEPRLDSIRVYSRMVERETVREVVREVERRGQAPALFGGRLCGGRLGVGVFGGVGIGGGSGAGLGMGPVVGVGLTYNFLCL